MNKARVEALSDGVFAIVMTLLVIEIKVPETQTAMTGAELWQEICRIGPLFASYALSYVVLAANWMTHHALFHNLFKSVDRITMLINLLFLGLLTIVPFSAHLVGTHPHVTAAVAFYGVNLLAIGLTGNLMFWYGSRQPEQIQGVSPVILHQGAIRQAIFTGCTLLGVLAIWLSIPLALLLFGFPIVFNVVPGLLTLLERTVARASLRKRGGK